MTDHEPARFAILVQKDGTLRPTQVNDATLLYKRCKFTSAADFVVQATFDLGDGRTVELHGKPCTRTGTANAYPFASLASVPELSRTCLLLARHAHDHQIVTLSIADWEQFAANPPPPTQAEEEDEEEEEEENADGELTYDEYLP
jgi:hypothetical protein